MLRFSQKTVMDEQIQPQESEADVEKEFVIVDQHNGTLVIGFGADFLRGTKAQLVERFTFFTKVLANTEAS